MVWALYFFLFSGFQKRRFGIFPAAVSQWLGHKTCWGSAFSHARPKHLFLEFGLVACRLPSLTLRKGLPCLRQPFFFVFSRFQKQRFGSFLAAVSHGLGTILLSFQWVPKATFRDFSGCSFAMAWAQNLRRFASKSFFARRLFLLEASFFFFVGLSLQNSRASLAFTLRAIAWSGMLFRSVFCA